MGASLTLIAACAVQNWRWTLGDTDALGLALTAAYLLVLALMLRAVRRAQGADRRLWLLVLAVTVLLAVNKQLDLQHQAQLIGRCWATAEGWYAARAGFQHRFALGVMAAGGLAGLALAIWLRAALPRNRLLLAGLALMAGFVALQLSRFQHLLPDGRTDLPHLAEAAALALLALASLRR